MRTRAEVVHRALLTRLEALREYISELMAEPPRGRSGLEVAHKLLTSYPNWVSENVQVLWDRSPDDTARYAQLSVVLQSVVLKTAFIEQWFGQQAALRIPLSLFYAVEATCEELGLSGRRAVLALGSPDNFETFIADLKGYLYSPLRGAPEPPGLPTDRFAMIHVPRFEGGEALWRPIVLGHEVAHLVVIERGALSSFDLPTKFDWARFSKTLPASEVYRLYRQSEAWVTELLCDAYMVQRFGPAALAAFAEFLDSVGAMEKASTTHPPGVLRLKLMLKWLGNVKTASLQQVVEPWVDAATASFAGPTEVIDLAAMLDGLADHFTAVTASWPPAKYNEDSRGRLISDL